MSSAGRFGGLFLWLVQSSCWAACLAPAFDVQTGVEHNVWEEFSGNGTRLVREQGDLPFAALKSELSCDWGTLGLRGAAAQGTRDYSGVNSNGAALTTQSDLRNTELTLSYAYPVQPNLIPFFSIGVVRSRRDIQSAGATLGYPEEYSMHPVQAGLKWRPQVFQNRLLLQGYGGIALQPRVDVSLPGRDRLTLDLGRTTSAGFAAELELGTIGEGKLLFVTEWSRTHIEKGSTGVVTRNGIPTGVATQPQSQLTQTWLSILWRKSL